MDPITIALIGSAVANLAGGYFGANASKDAATAQADAAKYAANLTYSSGQDALQLQKDVYAQQQANAAPWLATGKGALSKLAYLTGVTPEESAPLPFSRSTVSPLMRPDNTDPITVAQAMAGGSAGPRGQRPVPAGAEVIGTAVTRPGAVFRGHPIIPDGEPTPRGARTPASNQAPAANASSYVRLRSPNGQEGDVPADMVDHYLALGATRV